MSPEAYYWTAIKHLWQCGERTLSNLRGCKILYMILHKTLNTKLFHYFLLINLVTATTLGAFSGDLLTPSRSQKGKPTQFETTLVGEARGENGTHLAFTVFQASDGVKLTLFHHRFGSKTEAQTYFDKCLEKVGKIVTNTATKDASGVTVRQRAEVVLRVDGDSEKPDSAILWTNGPEFHEIVSKSSEDNLQLEKQIPN